MNGKYILGSKNTYGMNLKENGSGGNGRVGYTKFTKNGLGAVVCFLGIYYGRCGLYSEGWADLRWGRACRCEA